jgi:predicted  nucleic acid-binding Zn-ribbon protein
MRMANQEARSTAINLRTARKLLGHYETDVLAVSRQLKSVRRALVSLGKRLAEGAAEGPALTVVQEVVGGSRPFNADFMEALGVLSLQRRQPLKDDLDARKTELSRIITDTGQWRETKKTIKDKITGERRATRDKASERLQDLKSAVGLWGEELRRAQRRLQHLENDLTRRERGLLRWSKKTETLRKNVESLRQECLHHETMIRQSEEQRDAARNDLANARASFRPESDHPDLQESIEKLNELSLKKREVKNAISALNRQITAVENDFVDKVTDLETKFQSCSKALFEELLAVRSLVAPVRTSDRLWSPIDSDLDNWLAECKKRRTRAAVLLHPRRHPNPSDDERIKRDQIIRELVEFGDQRERRRVQAMERRAGQARERQRQREHAARERQRQRERAARERERQEARRERQIVAQNRREIRRVHMRQQTAEANLREFEQEHRRLDAQITQNLNAHNNAQNKLLRIKAQLKARNLDLEYIRANRSRFPRYDNAKARVEDLETEGKRLKLLSERRTRLRLAKSEADQRVAAELRSQSTSITREGSWAHGIEVNEWEDAERLAEKHMLRLGHPDARRTNAGADGGVDVESGRAVAQVKDQSNPVGRHLIQQLYGVARSKNKAAYFFARRYAPQAVEWARENGVKLYQFTRAGVVTEVL